MKFKNLFKLTLFNFSFLSVFLLITDIFISTINLKRSLIFPTLPKFNVPRQTCSIKTIYDASAIYKTNSPYLIDYQRDKDCYRSKDNLEKNSQNKKIILTIGGSTTDQRFVKEGDTFQDLLDQKYDNKYDFINGGVDGQSSVGHLYSMKQWHSKALENNEVRHIIYYLGVNDQGLTKLSRDKLNKKNSFQRNIRDYLTNNSYIYSQLKNIYFSKSFPKTFNIMAVHGEEFIPLGVPIYKEIKIQKDSFSGYKKLINDLINATVKYFPDAKIHIVQQQIPGCRFETVNNYFDRHSSNYQGVCKSIGEVFLSINNALEKNKNASKVIIYPMYLEIAIDDDGFYDFIHTNKKGSYQIAEYLFKNLNIK